MITYCPSCHTYFRVHTEQLAARAGQVRCGKCSRVFDALEHLAEETTPARAPLAKDEFEADGSDKEEEVNVPESATAVAPDIDATARDSASAQGARVVAETAEPEVETLRAAISEPDVAMTNVGPQTASGTSAFGFGPGEAAKHARSARRWLWLLGAIVMLLILLIQAAYHYRSAIILVFPETKPYAVGLCASLGCKLPLPRRIELMSIEASDLQADTTNPNVMVLSATFKNRAIFNQQHPLLELTLTDTEDRPVVRRVLTPQDYLGKSVDTQTGFAANNEIAIKVFIEGSQVKATGYRLYLFYP
jgi:predicted Zn finger-like uncharacterized protein